MARASQQISVEVEPRNISFGITKAMFPRYWFRDDPWSTHFMNALFSFVPVGERFLCHEFRKVLNEIQDPSIHKAALGLIKQERLHAREHAVMNEALAEYDIPIQYVEEIFQPVIKAADYLPMDLKCAFAAISEHFTAILSEIMFEHPEIWDETPPEVASLMYWHFIEETEHKSVAFDVFQERMGDRGLRMYLVRSLATLMSFSIFVPMMNFLWLDFVRRDGQLGNFRSAFKAAKLYLFKPGINRKIWLQGPLSFLKPGFHPWDRDNRDVLSAWKKVYDKNGDALEAYNALRDWLGKPVPATAKISQVAA